MPPTAPSHATPADTARGLARHTNTIEHLAEELHRPVQEIALLYVELLAPMLKRASVFDYLPLLVAKRIKRQLRQ